MNFLPDIAWASFGAIAGVAVLAAVALGVLIYLRRVVPTNEVHIIQATKRTTPYGHGEAAGNTYYAWPAWVPIIGITIRVFPRSIFEVTLSEYPSYDKARLPFKVDVTAFFRIEEPNTAALRVEDYDELLDQLKAILQGAVRRVLATNDLENIMEARAELGKQFTEEVLYQVKQWGVVTVKTIEFMDLRDLGDGKVIHNIMAKEQSRIDRESRIVVASNKQQAELAEIDAQRTVDVQEQDAEQQVGLRTATKEQTVGIAKQQAEQKVLEEAASTAKKQMEVKNIEDNRAAEIARQVAETNAVASRNVMVAQAEGEKEAIALRSAGDLTRTLNEAQGLQAAGAARAEAERLLQLAPVAAQIELAREIGLNQEYQKYLITVRQIEAGQAVGTSMSDALAKAELKVISTGGDGNILGDSSRLVDMFTAQGGTKLSAMLTALSQTPAGKALLKSAITRLEGE